VYAAELVWPR
jgi:hypothetical protein